MGAVFAGFMSVSFALDLKAKSAIVVEERTGIVLFEKDADAIRYPASTTKILTALLLLETTDLGETVIAPASCVQVEGASLHLKPNETLSARDLLYGILLRSANDGCHAFAVHLDGSDELFAARMNERAKAIGCARTHFCAPHGLHNDRHYTTARDLAMIAREAMKNEQFRSIVSRRRATISRSINTKDTLLISKNALLDEDKSYDGIKTGYTKVAGGCFVGSAIRNGMRVITVILNSEDWKSDQVKLMNWAHSNYVRTAVFKKGDALGDATIATNPDVRIPVHIQADIPFAHKKITPPNVEVVLVPKEGLSFPIEKGAEVGVAEISDGKGWTVKAPIFASERVERPILANPASLGFWVGGIVLVGLTVFAKHRSRTVSQWASTR